jgi:hypothetical protein
MHEHPMTSAAMIHILSLGTQMTGLTVTEPDVLEKYPVQETTVFVA